MKRLQAAQPELDASAQHTGRTGRETLTIAQLLMGLPRRRVQEMLELTPQEASRRVSNYSLGMRQRLGIAGGCCSTCWPWLPSSSLT